MTERGTCRARSGHVGVVALTGLALMVAACSTLERDPGFPVAGTREPRLRFHPITRQRTKGELRVQDAGCPADQGAFRTARRPLQPERLRPKRKPIRIDVISSFFFD